MICSITFNGSIADNVKSEDTNIQYSEAASHKATTDEKEHEREYKYVPYSKSKHGSVEAVYTADLRTAVSTRSCTTQVLYIQNRNTIGGSNIWT